MTSSNGNIFRVTGHLCGKLTGPRWIPAQRPVTRSFDDFLDLLLNKRLSKQSWGWWFETLPRSLWRHCNELRKSLLMEQVSRNYPSQWCHTYMAHKMGWLIGPWGNWLQSQISKFQTHFNDKYLKHFLWKCYQVNATTPYWSLVNIGSGNGLVPSGNKPLLEPMVTQISVTIWCH